MTGSRASGLITILLALFLVGAPSAVAKSDVGAPIQLPGAGDDDDVEGPLRDVPRTVPTRPGADELGIEVGVISSRAPTIGTLSGTDGLGREIWAGTSLTRAQILLNQIPIGAPSLAMANLTRRLLLTATRPPEDARGGDGLLELRLERTLDAGLINAVPTMIDQATHLEADPDIQMLRAETILLRGGGMETCTNQTAYRLESEAPFWMKLRAYCFAQQGLVPAARLTADLLYETDDPDALFQALLERKTGNLAVSLDGLTDQPLSALHLALMRDIGFVPPARRRMTAQPLSVARVMALDPVWEGEEGISFRLAMGEAAARAGGMSHAELLQVYEDVSPFEPSQRTEQLTSAARTNSPNARALFAEALSVDTILGTRAETLVAALGPAAQTDMALAYAGTLGHAVRDMRAEEVLTWASRSFALASLAGGYLGHAYEWYDIYSLGAPPSPLESQSLVAAIMMAAPSERFAFWPEHALGWLEQADLGEIPHERLTAQLIWFDAMGYTIPSDVQERLAAYEPGFTGAMPAPAVLSNLRAAAAAGRRGETVGYALVVIGEGGPRAAHPAAIGEAIRALRAVGLDADARAIAAEALLGFALDDAR